jgi:hypothetical protein
MGFMINTLTVIPSEARDLSHSDPHSNVREILRCLRGSG